MNRTFLYCMMKMSRNLQCYQYTACMDGFRGTHDLMFGNDTVYILSMSSKSYIAA